MIFPRIELFFFFLPSLKKMCNTKIRTWHIFPDIIIYATSLCMSNCSFLVSLLIKSYVGEYLFFFLFIQFSHKLTTICKCVNINKYIYIYIYVYKYKRQSLLSNIIWVYSYKHILVFFSYLKIVTTCLAFLF